VARLINQPTGFTGEFGPMTKKNYERSLLGSFTVDELSPYLTESELGHLRALYPNGNIKLWGTIDSKSNVPYWKKISPGDIVIFYVNGVIKHSARVVYRPIEPKPALARFIWGEKSEGETWCCVYFIDEFTEQDMPYSEVEQVINKAYPRGIIVYNEDIDELNLDQLDYFGHNLIVPNEVVPDAKQKTTRTKIKDDLRQLATEGTETVKIRREQRKLREYLLDGRDSAPCVICNGTFPKEFLVAAHLKKRAKCSEEERRDFDNIASLMCLTGCDALYENGYISIEDGLVVANKNKPSPSEKVERLIAQLAGSKVDDWNSQKDQYTAKHREYFKFPR